MAKNDHIHKYIKVKISDKWTVFKCQLSGCTHFIQDKLVVGRECICNHCNKPFTMTRHTATLKFPHCRACTGNNPLERVSKSNNVEFDLENILNLGD